jgi:hypothetical protein
VYERCGLDEPELPRSKPVVDEVKSVIETTQEGITPASSSDDLTRQVYSLFGCSSVSLFGFGACMSFAVVFRSSKVCKIDGIACTVHRLLFEGEFQDLQI